MKDYREFSLFSHKEVQSTENKIITNKTLVLFIYLLIMKVCMNELYWWSQCSKNTFMSSLPDNKHACVSTDVSQSVPWCHLVLIVCVR